jgi:hypothetical protein
MRALTFAVVALLASAGSAAAQPAGCTTPNPGAGFVCYGGQWLPPNHPLVPAAPPQEAPVCDPRPNPYTEPEQAAACSAWDAEHNPPPPMPTFEVGRAYKDAYDTSRMVVLAVGRSLEGIPVVTAQRTAPVAGDVFSFRTSAAEAQRWERLP